MSMIPGYGTLRILIQWITELAIGQHHIRIKTTTFQIHSECMIETEERETRYEGWLIS